MTGFNDMMLVLVIHRDLKLQNVMMHFPDHIQELASMQTDFERKEFIRKIDLETTRFEIKIADFGFSKKLKSKN